MKILKIYLHEVTAVSSAPLARVSSRNSGSPDGVALATVEVLGLDDLPDGLALAVGLERTELEGILSVDLGPGQTADGDVSAAVTGDRVLSIR